MPLATETDPRRTVLDILDATTDADYTASKPTHVERLEATERRIKVERGDDALYVWTPADGEQAQFSAGGSYTETQVVQIEAWTPTDEATAWERSRDVRDHIWSTYGFDNHASTNWHRIQPVGGTDYREEAAVGRASQHVCALQVRLTARRDV